MAIFKAVVHSDYAQIPNETAQDTSISFEARGLLTMLLSMPHDWEVHKSWVVSQSPAGKDKVSSIFDELIAAGYIRKEDGQRKFGKFSSDDYFVFPTKTTVAGFPQRSSRSGSTVNGESATTKETVKQKKHRTKETSIPPTGSTAPEGADSVCSNCGGCGWGEGDSGNIAYCNHCNGTGKEPTCNDGLQVVNSELTTDQPKAPADTAEQVGQTEHEAAPTDKPVKKRKTKAETLLDLIRSKPELLPCLNCVDDTLLLEWCQQRERMKAARTDRALSKIDRALDELRTKHRVAPDAAIEAACDKGWRGLEVEWVLNHLSSTGRNMSYPAQSVPRNNDPDTPIVPKTIQRQAMSDEEIAKQRAELAKVIKGAG